MLSMNIKDIVNRTVRRELRDKGRPEGLYFNFDLRLSHYVDNDEFCEQRNLHLIYHLRPNGTYISVFSARSTRREQLKDIVWKHETTHDSCWADVDIFARVYFDMADKINEKLKQSGRSVIAPSSMHEFNTFGFGIASNDMFRWLDCEVTLDPTDEYRHRRLIKILQK